jgi:two-component system sensor histidine kinase AlgZ
MHPIFSEFRRLAMYLVVWLFIGLLLAYLLTVSHDISPRDALVLALPLCLFYSFLCLSAWYSCRGRLPDKFTMGRLLATHITTGFFAAIIWTFAAAGLAHGLSKTAMFAGLSQRFRPEIPLIFCTGILLYLLSVAFYYIVISFEASRDAEARVMKASVLARDAELKALKAQVNPHFLFNSLNSISALTSSDPAKAREMCILLGDFLRRTLGLGEKAAIPLDEEISTRRRSPFPCRPCCSNRWWKTRWCTASPIWSKAATFAWEFTPAMESSRSTSPTALIPTRRLSAAAASAWPTSASGCKLGTEIWPASR